MAVVQLSLADICRSCMSRDNLESLSNTKRVKTIEDCLGVQISLCDGMPSKICSDCWCRCVEWSLFKEQFRKNEATLRSLLQFCLPGDSSSKPLPDEAVEVDLDADANTSTDDHTLIVLNEVEEGEDEELPIAVEKSPSIEISHPNLSLETQMKNIETVPTPSPPTAAPAELNTTGSTASLCCKHCDKKFRKKDMLEAHTRQHEGKKPFACKHCDKEFNSRLAFRNHTFTHSDTPFACPDCDRTFNYPQLVEEHRKRMHQAPTKMFPCTVCQKEFNRAQTLQTHMLTHTDEKPMECNICHGRFKSDVYLKIHQVRHSNVRSFECKEQNCQRSFFTKSELNFHRRNVHTSPEKKPIACAHCDRRFTKQSQLDVHMVKHKGQMSKFKCKDCPKNFNTAKLLKDHRKVAH